jgi:hypothetical protein
MGTAHIHRHIAQARTRRGRSRTLSKSSSSTDAEVTPRWAAERFYIEVDPSTGQLQGEAAEWYSVERQKKGHAEKGNSSAEVQVSLTLHHSCRPLRQPQQPVWFLGACMPLHRRRLLAYTSSPEPKQTRLSSPPSQLHGRRKHPTDKSRLSRSFVSCPNSASALE